MPTPTPTTTAATRLPRSARLITFLLPRLGHALILVRLLRNWLDHRGAEDEAAVRRQLERNRSKLEYRLAWFRLALVGLPLIELAAAPDRPVTATSCGMLAYALVLILLTRQRLAPPLWRWLFVTGDAVLLGLYTFLYLPGATATEAAYAYLVVANLLILVNALRLSQPLLWGGAAVGLGLYYLRFDVALTDLRLAATVHINLLITTVLGAILLRNQKRLLVETRARARLRRFFTREVADTLEQQSFCLEKNQAEARVITVLFVDIRNFTTLAQGLSPEETVRFLNTFFGHVTQAVFDQGGTVDKYIGDCVMALFGAPLRTPDHATRAVVAAQSMVAAMETWSRQRIALGQDAVKIGVGLNTTTAVVGTLGSEQKIEYTAIGDGVNIASRVCGLTKSYPSYAVLLTEETRAQLSREMAGECIDLGPTEIKGRSGTIKLHGLAPAVR